MAKKAALGMAATLASALLVAWFVHFLGPAGKAPRCLSSPDFRECVTRKMCEMGHLPHRMCTSN